MRFNLGQTKAKITLLSLFLFANISLVNKQKYFWVVLSAAFVLFMVKLDAFVVNVSVPTIGHAFSLSVAKSSLIIVVYLLMLTNTMLIFGKLEDMFGIKKIFLGGYLLFTIGSLFCGLAPTFLTLVLARAFQGVGGALLLIGGVGAGVFNVANNLSMVLGVCVFQIIFSHLTRLANLPDPTMPVASPATLSTYFSAFYGIFVFAGLLYLLAAVFSVAAERAK
jgi:MFS family permease